MFELILEKKKLGESDMDLLTVALIQVDLQCKQLLGNPDHFSDILKYYNMNVQSSMLQEIVGDDEDAEGMVGLGSNSEASDGGGFQDQVMNLDNYVHEPSELEAMLVGIEGSLE